MSDAAIPFRWDIARREQIGALLDEHPPVTPDFLPELRQAAAGMIALSGGADLAFVGRSPENFFDYLSGAFEGVEDAPETILLQYSARYLDAAELRKQEPRAFAGICAYLAELRLDPDGLAQRSRPVALVDFVAAGGTFEGLVGLLRQLAEEQRHDWPAIQRKLRLIGITERKKNSPNTWRWWQQGPWESLAPGVTIKSVSVDWWFWSLLANHAVKTTRSHYLGRWANPERTPIDDNNLRALSRAVALYDVGRERAERLELAAQLASRPEMREAWLRSLQLRLKQ